VNPEFFVGPAADPGMIRLGPALTSGTGGVLYPASLAVESGEVSIAGVGLGGGDR
jgi:hypothetical protein